MEIRVQSGISVYPALESTSVSSWASIDAWASTPGPHPGHYVIASESFENTELFLYSRCVRCNRDNLCIGENKNTAAECFFFSRNID